MGWLFGSISAFALAILSQAVLLRWFGVRHGIVAFVCGGVVIGLLLVASLVWLWPLYGAIAGTLLYAFLCELWMFILSVTFSSVAASLLMHLRMRPIALDDINRLFDDRVMIQNRIGWLTNIGAAVLHDGTLTATGAGKKLASLFNAFRSFFGHH